MENYINVNQNFLRVFVYSKKEVIGKNGRELGIITQSAMEKIVPELKQKGFGS
jgi:hypothetical protein